MISALSVLVLGDSLGQPLQLSGLSFDILSSLEAVFFVVLPKRKQGRGMSGLSFELESLILGLALLRQGLGAGFKLLARGFWAYTLGICVWSLRVWARTLCNSILLLDDSILLWSNRMVRVVRVHEPLTPCFHSGLLWDALPRAQNLH